MRPPHWVMHIALWLGGWHWVTRKMPRRTTIYYHPDVPGVWAIDAAYKHLLAQSKGRPR